MNDNTTLWIRDVFYGHLNIIAGEVSKKEVISKQQIKLEIDKRKKQEEKRRKAYKIPLIGRMILSYNLNYHETYKESSIMYECMLKLADGCNLNYLDVERMHQIINDREQIYEKLYREDYEYVYNAKMSNLMANGLKN